VPPTLGWTVETLNHRVDAEILAMPDDFQASLTRILDRIRALGLERVGEPHVKHLRGKLWEMRLKGRDGIGRAIYVTAIGRRVVIVLAFVKKTQQTPPAVLALAERRAREVGR
jgi:phage-related protein